MAKLECELAGNFNTILQEIEDAILDGSSTASREDASDFSSPHCRCACASMSGTVCSAATASA